MNNIQSPDHEYQNLIDILAEMVTNYIANQLTHHEGEESNAKNINE
ncbi:hypothetical protein [Virgibacillus sp. L01]